jgi:hypothetical protein
VWLVVGALITGARWYPRLVGIPPPAVWAASPYDALHHVLLPVSASGVMAPAVVWALAAVVLPHLARGRSMALDVVRVSIWSAMLVLASMVVLTVVHGSGAAAAASTALAGGVAGALIALGGAWLGPLVLRWRPGTDPAGPQGQFP